MEELNTFFDFSSSDEPTMTYPYDDSEAHTPTSSTSPIDQSVRTYPPRLVPLDLIMDQPAKQYEASYPTPQPSLEQTEGSSDPDQQTETPPQTPTKSGAKRKRENRYKNAPPSVLSRRRAQNRASQRAYRERKDQRIKDLEILLLETQQKNDVLTQAYAALQAQYAKLKSEQEAVDPPCRQARWAYDPLISTASSDKLDPDLFLYHDSAGVDI